MPSSKDGEYLGAQASLPLPNLVPTKRLGRSFRFCTDVHRLISAENFVTGLTLSHAFSSPDHLRHLSKPNNLSTSPNMAGLFPIDRYTRYKRGTQKVISGLSTPLAECREKGARL